MKQDAASATPPVEAGSDAMAVPQPNTPSLQHSNTPPRIPDHDLLKKIGGGSYGEVWLARNVIGTHHAVKIIYRSAFDNDRPFEREFEGIKNAEPISRSIPGLVHILQVGRNDEAGYFYYVMELADSPEVREQKSEVREQKSTKAKARPSDLRPLTSDFSLYTPRTLSSELKQRGALPVEECVQLGLTLTAALHALHEKGLVHRDIKPSNITFVNGEPKLADIGLMASTGEARSFVGTAGFIPPEGPGTPQADLYSLGKVLYELSTGKDRQEFPELPAELIQSRSSRREEAQTSKSEIGNRKSERDQSLLTSAATALLELNAILVKACETDFRKRYGTAQQMHDDLALLQRGHSIRRKRAVERRFVLAKQMSVAVAAFTMLTIGVWSLSKRFDRAGIESSGTANLQAYNEFRLGRFFWNKRTAEGLSNAISHFKRATEFDPKFARAYASLAETYVIMPDHGGAPARECWPKAQEAAVKALQLDNTLAEAHAVLGFAKLISDWNWPGAQEEFKRAIQLNPNYATAHQWYSIYLSAMGRHPEAISEGQRAEELDPTSLPIRTCLASRFTLARQYDRTTEQARTMLAMDPNFAYAHLDLGDGYAGKGMYAEAVAEWEKFGILSGQNPEEVATLKEAFLRLGIDGYRRKQLEQLQQRTNDHRHVSASNVAELHALLGNREQALTWLYKAYEERDCNLILLKVRPGYDSLREDPRYIELLKNMGLDK